MNNPVLSVIVAIASDTTSHTDTLHLAPCLAALRAQNDPPDMEVILPLPSGVSGIEALRRQYSDVRMLEFNDLRKYSRRANSREHHGELISRGFVAARGAIFALIEDHDVVAPDWSSQVVNAHRLPFAAVGGAIENGIDRPLNWAVYFSDFQPYQNPLPPGNSSRASDANVSYKRTALEQIRAVWDNEFHEAQVNGALASLGHRITLARDVVVYQQRQGLRLGTALRERFVWGRSFGAWRCKQEPDEFRWLRIFLFPALPVLLMIRRSRLAVQKRVHLGSFVRAFPLTCLLTVGWCCGELMGSLTKKAVSRKTKAATQPAGHPQAVS